MVRGIMRVEKQGMARIVEELGKRSGSLIRLALVVGLVAIMLGIFAGDASAADSKWPTFQPAPLPKSSDFRGPGNYLNWIKILACVSVFLLWVKTTDWVSTDCQDLNLDYMRWNPIVFGSFFAAYVLLWLLPSFWIGFPLLVIAYIAPFTAYVVHRNSKVDNNERVFTPEHLRFWFATHLNKMGMKLDVEKRDPHETGPPVKVFARGGADEREDSVRLLQARQSPGLRTAREILADALIGRASAIMLDYTQDAVGVRTMVDGVWIPWEPRPRDTGDQAAESLKLLCGLNPQDRQRRQQGSFAVEYQAKRFNASLASQGTATGERLLIQFEQKAIALKTLDELGMRAKLQEELRSLLEAEQGFVLLSAMPANGLRTTSDVVLHACDRFTREFAALEDENNRYNQIENVPVITYNPKTGQSAAEALPKFFRGEPNVAVIRDLVDARCVEFICDQIRAQRLIVSTIRSKDCAEALLRVLALGVAPASWAESVTGVLNQRLVRKLCDSCKEAYTPTPQALQQLGMAGARVSAFYRPPTPNPEEPKEPCKECNGIGYLGRTAIFELLTVGDNVRKVLPTNPKIELLRQAARKDGMKTLQEEGLLLVARGVTSLPELMRVLKQ